MTTIVDVIAAGPGLRPDGGGSCAVLDADGLITAELPWTGVHERARRIATVLADEGIGAGQRIGLLADTSLDLVCTLQAIWLVGAAVNVLPPPTRRTNTLHAIMADADLHAVVADALAIDVLRRAPDPPRLLGLPEVAMLANRAEPAAIHHPDGRDLAVLQYTSGSTRNPRGVPVTHAHLAANIEAINTATVHTDHSGRMLSWLPLFHDMGLIGFLAKPMWCGCSLLLQSPTAFLRRPHSPEDLGFLYDLATSPATSYRWRYRGAPPPLERFKEALWQQVLVQYVARRIDNDEPTGHLLAYGAEPGIRYAYIGAVFTPAVAGTGLAARAVATFMRHLFHIFPLHKLYLQIPGYNWNQMSSGQGDLFHIEGVLKDHCYFAGQTWDEYLCAVYADQFHDNGRT